MDAKTCVSCIHNDGVAVVCAGNEPCFSCLNSEEYLPYWEDEDPKTDESGGYKMRIKLDPWGIMPTRAYPTDAGLDLYSPLDCWVYAGGLKIINLGVHAEIPDGYVGLLTSKSGLMSIGITTRGTIDAGYTGSIKAVVYNDSKESYRVAKGQKITQLVIVPCLIPEIEVVDELSETERGENGFGSSGA